MIVRSHGVFFKEKKGEYTSNAYELCGLLCRTITQVLPN